jgi:hypothetical protein
MLQWPNSENWDTTSRPGLATAIMSPSNLQTVLGKVLSMVFRCCHTLTHPPTRARQHASLTAAQIFTEYEKDRRLAAWALQPLPGGRHRALNPPQTCLHFLAFCAVASLNDGSFTTHFLKRSGIRKPADIQTVMESRHKSKHETFHVLFPNFSTSSRTPTPSSL